MTAAPPDLMTTERLLLRKPRRDDAPRVLEAYAHDPEVTRFLTWRPDQTCEEIERFLEGALAAWDRGSAFCWAITLRETGELIGMIDVRMETHANIGYVLARPHWGRGLTTEAVRAVVGWALAQEEIHRVWAVCDTENGASARVMEKAGLQREGVLRKWMVFPNIGPTPRDCYVYSAVR